MNRSSKSNQFPLVSIITPSYNQANFLEETILSVVRQDYPNIEYLVIDGASTDGSQEIIKKYSGHISWWVSEKDSGQSEAVNKGFKRATGEIIGWINSDDIYLKGAVSKAVQAFKEHPDAGMIFANILSIDEHTRVFNTIQYDDWHLEDILQFRIIGQPGVFMKRLILERVGYLDPSYHLLLDQHLWVRMASTAEIKHLDDYLAAARSHSAAKNIAQSPNYHKEVSRVVDWMAENSDLMEKFQRNKRKILAGASTFNARYLMDGGLYKQAFREYLKAIRQYPPIPLEEFRRILFAFFSQFMKLDLVKFKYLQKREEKINSMQFEDLLSFIEKTDDAGPK